VLPSGNRSIEVCSQSYPVINPATASVTVRVKECDCT